MASHRETLFIVILLLAVLFVQNGISTALHGATALATRGACEGGSVVGGRLLP